WLVDGLPKGNMLKYEKYITTYHVQHIDSLEELGSNEKKKIPAKVFCTLCCQPVKAMGNWLEKLYTWDIVGGHAEIIHTERMPGHVCDLDELNIEKPQEWYTLTKEEKIKVFDLLHDVKVPSGYST
ncbi:hypothetical protein ACJX0J_007576, partial [Zea mays]